MCILCPFHLKQKVSSGDTVPGHWFCLCVHLPVDQFPLLAVVTVAEFLRVPVTRWL